MALRSIVSAVQIPLIRADFDDPLYNERLGRAIVAGLFWNIAVKADAYSWQVKRSPGQVSSRR